MLHIWMDIKDIMIVYKLINCKPCFNKKKTNLKVICMVRLRGAGFCHEKEDYETLLLDARSMTEHGADGIAFGCLEDKAIQELVAIVHN